MTQFFGRCQTFSALICSVFGFQDLNILRQFRRQGIASHLLDRVEAEVARHSGVVGIGVGFYPGYNAAQRLYVRRGYVPDGRMAGWPDGRMAGWPDGRMARILGVVGGAQTRVSGDGQRTRDGSCASS
jgi:Acetyltransferase (GNAT) domain